MMRWMPFFLLFVTIAVLRAEEPPGAAESPAAVQPAPEQAAATPETPPAMTLVAAEEQVPFDAEGKILAIDENLRVRYGLFPDIADFRQAMLFRKDGAYELALTTADGDRRVPITTEQLAAIRGKLSPKPAEPPILVTPAPEPSVPSPLPKKAPLYDESDGFGTFLAYTTLWAGIYGAEMPFVFGGSGTHWAYYPGISFLSAGVTFGLGYYFGEEAGITRGMAFGAGEGALRGAVDGMLLWWLIGGNLQLVRCGCVPMDGENDCPPCADEGDTDIGIDTESYGRLLFASSMLLSMTEYAIGMWYAKSAGRTGGEMRLLGAGSLFGYLTMMELMAASLDADFFNRREAIRFVPAMMLAGGIGGLFLGHAVGRWDRYTEGDAALLETGMMLGTYLPVSILITAKSNDPQLYYGLMLPGTVIGAIGSYFLLRGLDFSHLDAFLINLGTLAGGLVTTGIGFLATMETKQYEGLAVASSVGLIAGYGVMYAVFRNKGLRQAADEDARQSWHFRIHPEGVMTALTRPAAATPRSEEDLRLLREMPATPIVSFEYRW